MLVGLPKRQSVAPEHVLRAPASATRRSRTSTPGIPAAPSATRPAIFSVLPLAESYRTSTFPIVPLPVAPGRI